MLQDPQLSRAVARIIQRSERQDTQKLITTYVEIGLRPQLENTNHQIFYGRRGTGKTHLTKILETELKNNPKNTITYIDCRTLGSTTQFSDQEKPINQRCLALFRDILINVYHSLLEHIVDIPSEYANKALEKVDGLVNLVTEPILSLQPETLKTQKESTTKRNMSLETGLNIASVSLNPKASVGSEKGTKDFEETQYSISSEDKIVFPDLYKTLNDTLNLADTHLYILIDEWSSLPLDIQPYLAEFLKRGVLTVNSCTLKISALEYRCRFNLREPNGIIGFELGADISTAIDLDDYFVFDRNPNQIVSIYSDILFKHLSSELPRDYLKHTHMVSTGDDLIAQMFTERKTFEELSRAAEGVIRDLINIFTKAFFDANKRGRVNIDKKSITESARQWFEQDKSQNHLDDQLQEILQKIVTEVIGDKKARSFLLPRDLERHPVIQSLFDARVLHHLQRGYADKDNPGVRYNIYTIDYGTYVDLIGTSKQPQLGLFDMAQDSSADSLADLVVPFDDKRSIRRIILNESILNPR
jgi:hypothetical protein